MLTAQVESLEKEKKSLQEDVQKCGEAKPFDPNYISPEEQAAMEDMMGGDDEYIPEDPSLPKFDKTMPCVIDPAY